MEISQQFLTFNEKNEEIFRAESSFCDIYFEALSRILNIKDLNNVRNLRSYIDLLRPEANAFCEFFKKEENDVLNLLADSLYYRLTYLYRNSQLLSSAVWHHFRNTLEDNEVVLQKLMKKSLINICSLGCGPASDIVAIINVLESEARLKDITLDIRVTAVDVDDSWKNTCLAVLHCLERFRYSTWKINFIQTDLSQFHSVEFLEAIQKADIVTMVKFSSEFMQKILSFKDTVQEIANVMKPGSLLFFLDRHNKDVIRSTRSSDQQLQGLQVIYEELCDLHTLESATVELNYQLYDSHFGFHVSNTCLKVLARTWVKSNSSLFKNELFFKTKFMKKKEKYDAFQFFSSDSFEKWESFLAENMTKVGWIKEGIEGYTTNLKNMMTDLYRSLEDAVELLELTRRELRDYEENEEINARELMTFTSRKVDLAFVKRQIYCEEIILLRGYLKAKSHGCWKE